MGKSRADRRRSSGKATYRLFAPETVLGWRVVRWVPESLGEQKVAQGEWRRVYDEQGNHVGYQMLAGTQYDHGPFPDSYRSSVIISPAEMRMIAGEYGRSRTLGMSEQQRLLRHARYDKSKILPPEDAIERAHGKLCQLTTPASRIDDGSGEPVFGDRAVRAYPTGMRPAARAGAGTRRAA